ncbi:hypothetical protein J9317_02300 [Metabacillus sp. KIGAM252]|uniref:Uncharacterized protein n=1 Tax=Metabacillus flavus TaxID=2823519 RepID=A0ABS5LA53_9BACI|nr:hypothetical protein [Metabacillus flavus]MBS2967602.1 hypothetical protein [Metabacillus flavus]
MPNFLKTLQPFILSEDPILQDFALKKIDDARLGNDETFHLALDANDKNTPNNQTNTILPYTYSYQIGQAGAQRLVDLLKKKDHNLYWYRTIFSHLDSERIEGHFEEVRPVMEEEHLTQLESIIKLNHLSISELQNEHSRVTDEMESQGLYNDNLYTYCKRITDRLIKWNAYTSEEIEEIIQQETKQDYFTYKGYMAVYAAGELKIHSLVEDLAKLTLRGREEILVEEVEAALIKIGTDEVITCVAPCALDPDEFYSSIAVLKNSKSELAVEKLLSLFDSSHRSYSENTDGRSVMQPAVNRGHSQTGRLYGTRI